MQTVLRLRANSIWQQELLMRVSLGNSLCKAQGDLQGISLQGISEQMLCKYPDAEQVRSTEPVQMTKQRGRQELVRRAAEGWYWQTESTLVRNDHCTVRDGTRVGDG